MAKKHERADTGSLSLEDGYWVRVLPVQEWYSVIQIEVLTGTSCGRLYSYSRQGSLKSYKVKGVLRIKHADLLEFLRWREERAAPPDPDRDPVVPVVPSPEDPRKRLGATLPEATPEILRVLQEELEFL